MTLHQPCRETCTCGCCEGTAVLTPLSRYNRPGLDTLSYRVGRHGELLETMKARLSSRDYPALKGLKTRDSGDFSLALLDSWATVGDVLSFYQERILSEGYLRTATERRSVLELSRLVGYAPRPGVAASVHLAYTLEDAQDVTIPKGSRAQSVPGPGELPQSFETSEDLVAYAALNTLGLRLKRPQRVLSDALPEKLYIEGVAANLKAGDTLLLHFDGYSEHQLITVQDVATDNQNMLTLLKFATSTVAPRALSLGTVERIHNVAEHATATSVMGFPRAGAQAELALLNALLEVKRSDAMMEVLGTEVLPGLEAAHIHAVESGTTRKAPWLENTIAELRAVLDASENRPTLLTGLVSALKKPPSLPPASRLRLGRNVARLYAGTSDLIPKLYTTLFPQTKTTAYAALAATPATQSAPLDGLEVMQVRAALFGHTFPRAVEYDDGEPVLGPEPNVRNTWTTLVRGLEALDTLALDTTYEQIKVGSWLAVRRPLRGVEGDSEFPDVFIRGWQLSFHQVVEVESRTLSAHNLSTRVTLLRVDPAWLDDGAKDGFRQLLTWPELLRSTSVHAAGDALALAEEPMEGVANDVTDGQSDYLELDDLYRGLEPGRWAIVSGERTDEELLKAQGKLGVLSEAERSTGVFDAELVMIAEVAHGFLGTDYSFVPSDEAYNALPGDSLHTFIKLAEPLEYRYKRSTVKIYGNVVKATHGETKTEVLGAGNATQAFQTFALKQPPLTYLAAPIPEGVENTLEVFVNDVQWREAKHFPGLNKNDRNFVMRIDDNGKTSVVFGNGETGARLPTGLENVRARYRSGLGKPGNVAAKQISLLTSRPLGIKEVINPLPATGGADRESRDLARKNAPKALMALDRLVSVQDYADFAETFAGIGKASAAELSNGTRQLVHVSVAGVDDMLIAPSSDLYRNLLKALRELGDPYYPLALESRTLKLLVIEARVRIHPDYRWETVEPTLREAMLTAFGFDKRNLGQAVRRAEVLSTLQSVAGVAYVDLETFGALGAEALGTGDPAEQLGLAETVRVNLATFDPDTNDLNPAELAVLSPDVPDTLILSELT